MAYKISSTIVIDNNASINSTGIITATSFSGKGTIPASTTVVFQQTNAPTGFTKVTTYNDYTLRIVSGTGGSTAGTVNFSTAFPTSLRSVPFSGNSGDRTLTIPQLPSHTHGGITISPGTQGAAAPTGARIIVSPPQGGDAGHTHPITGTASIDFRVKYIDVILATRDA